MARNGSGSYSLPAGNPVVTGTTISSTVHNNTLSDIATALTNSIAKDGQTTPTANLPMGTFKHTGVAAASSLTDYARADQAQNSSLEWLSSVSGSDTITASATPTPSAYAAGQTFRFVSAGANTGAVTLNVSGLGAKSVTKNGATALAAGDIPSGAVVTASYDGAQFQLIGLAANTANTASTASAANAGPGNTQFSHRNKIINGDFSINQLALTSPVTLSAGAYGHDGWKAGASGCTYSFSTTNGLTTITITAGSLQQVIEDKFVPYGTNSLYMSWTGTAQGKIAGGSYSVSGVSASVTGGSSLTIEFNTGTLTKVQVEVGGVTPYEQRDDELRRCQRYFCKTFDQTVAPAANTGNRNGAVTVTYNTSGGFRANWVYPVEMRGVPSIAAYNPNAAGSGWRDTTNSVDYAAAASAATGTRQTDIGASSSSAGSAVYMIHLTASARL